MIKETKQKKPRVDKRKNVWKVAEVLAKNPNKSIKEIQKETNLWVWTIHRAKEEVEKSGIKDETIAYIVHSSKERIKRAVAIFDKYLDQVEEKDKLDRADIALTKDIVKDDMARVNIFWWDVTDDEGWLKAIQDITITIWN